MVTVKMINIAITAKIAIQKPAKTRTKVLLRQELLHGIDKPVGYLYFHLSLFSCVGCFYLLTEQYPGKDEANEKDTSSFRADPDVTLDKLQTGRHRSSGNTSLSSPNNNPTPVQCNTDGRAKRNFHGQSHRHCPAFLSVAKRRSQYFRRHKRQLFADSFISGLRKNFPVRCI